MIVDQVTSEVSLPVDETEVLSEHPLFQLQTLIPVLVVATLWILVSFGTSIYLNWVEGEYDKFFSQNLTSIQAASELESAIWQSVGVWSDPALTSDLLPQKTSDLKSLTTQKLEILRSTPSSSLESEQMQELQERLTEYIGTLETESSIRRMTSERQPETLYRLTQLANRISEHANSIRQINHDLMNTSRDALSRTHNIVMLIRMVLVTLGPLLGLVLGWRTSQRLRSSVSEIAVTLSDSGDEQELKVNILPPTSLNDVRRQAERVVNRLRHVGQELQSARRDVIRSERLAAVGELAAGVAHELRNPLTSVKLLLQHAARQPQDARISDSQLELILREIGRMEATIQGLLDFSRAPTLNRVVHDLKDTLARSINLVDGRLRQAGIQLSTAICADPLWVNGDSEQLNQVFVNLLINSIEAMPSGGQLRIAARPGGDQSAEVVVMDSGGGIAPEIMSRLFEPFATSKERGTGLGLAVSNRIIRDHDGKILVQNMPDQGASFTVILPTIQTTTAIKG